MTEIVLLGIRLENALELLHLFLRFLRQLIIHILECRPNGRLLLTLRVPKFFQHGLAQLIARLLLHILIPQALILQPLPQANDRVVPAFPVLDLYPRPVRETIIAGTVVRDTVAHRFDEDWPAAVRERNAARFPHRLVHGKDVIAVNADRVDAVAHAAAGDTVAAVLVERRGGDGVAVVAADEDDGAGPRGGDVQAGVEVAFAGGALAEVAGYDAGRGIGVLEGLELQGVGGAGGLGNLGCEWGGDGVLACCVRYDPRLTTSSRGGRVLTVRG